MNIISISIFLFLIKSQSSIESVAKINLSNFIFFAFSITLSIIVIPKIGVISLFGNLSLASLAGITPNIFIDLHPKFHLIDHKILDKVHYTFFYKTYILDKY